MAVDPPPAGVVVGDVVHAQEHALEVQLPFLQWLLGDTLTVLPIAAGPGADEQAADLLEPAWADLEVLLVCSTDLSHYLDRAGSEAQDRRTAQAVLDLTAEAIGPDDACGRWALRAVLTLARRHGASAQLLDLRTSADTAGHPDRVVGYGAFTIS